MEIIQELTLDTLRENTFKVIYAKQYDQNTRKLIITVTAQGEERTVKSTDVISLSITRADSEYSEFGTCSLSQGKILVTLPNWLLQCAGKSVCHISLVENNGSGRLSTLDFIVDVEAAQRPSGATMVDSKNQLLQDFYAEAQKVSQVRSELTAAVEKNAVQDTRLSSAESRISALESSFKGATQAYSYSNYSTLINELNSVDSFEFNIGTNFYVLTSGTKGMRVSGKNTTKKTYTYTSDSEFESKLAGAGAEVGYYVLTVIEQEVNLTGYVQKTELSSYVRKEELPNMEAQEFTFTLEDGSTVTKKIYIQVG